MSPLADGEFAAAVAALGPFETNPALAVAVSGGADSMALCLLADGWARARAGRILALIVDHGLRDASPEEAGRTASWLAARGIDSEVLAWVGDKPASAIQARARAKRYRLLFDRCRQAGILHLLVGHHLEDQAETLLLRAASGSGAVGLAGMSRLVEAGSTRVLRPLLEVSKQRLRAYLESVGQPWIEDPSNADPAYARSRLRSWPAETGAGAQALVDAAASHRRRRRVQDEAVADLLARHCRLHPLGCLRLDPAMLDAAAEDAVGAALGRVAATVGGTAYPPASEKLDRLRRHLLGEAPAAASLGRCLWRPCRAREKDCDQARFVVVIREARGLPQPMPIAAGAEVEWDGRFLVRFAARPGEPDRGLTLAPLTGAGWRQALRLRPGLRGEVPFEAAVSLPAIWGEQGLLAVPGLGVYPEPSGRGLARASFRPRRSLSGPGYYLA